MNQTHPEARYQSGFGNAFATEALPGALPAHRNSPQQVAYGLYAEQISGTAFTAPRSHNRRSWLYRIRPAAMHGAFTQIDAGRIVARFDGIAPPPSQLRWSPLPMPDGRTDFIDGWVTMAGNGSAEAQAGLRHPPVCGQRRHGRPLLLFGRR
jgi:homogentisate 1,2-dioxygenase